jgi:ferritin-like metal-binding protein YciE
MSALGQSLVLNAGEPSGIDETLIAAELKLPHAERLRRFEALYAFAQQAGRARARRGP